jgi:hypothetical protein
LLKCQYFKMCLQKFKRCLRAALARLRILSMPGHWLIFLTDSQREVFVNTALVFTSECLLFRTSIWEVLLFLRAISTSDIWKHFRQCLVCNCGKWFGISTTRLWAVGQNYFALWHPPGEYIFCGSMHSTIDAQLPQKVPKQKTCQTAWK